MAEQDGRERSYERFGWLFSGGLLATRPATAAIARLSRIVSRMRALVGGDEEPRREADGDDD